MRPKVRFRRDVSCMAAVLVGRFVPRLCRQAIAFSGHFIPRLRMLCSYVFSAVLECGPGYFLEPNDRPREPEPELLRMSVLAESLYVRRGTHLNPWFKVDGPFGIAENLFLRQAKGRRSGVAKAIRLPLNCARTKKSVLVH